MIEYVFLQKNSHIAEGEKTACGLPIPADAERTEQATVPHCLMCWLKRGGSQLTVERMEANINGVTPIKEGRGRWIRVYGEDSESSP